MSGRSGYGRSRIVGKLIHLPANMNMAGLAPRVGKPGWAIRLYYQRVDECFCCIPLKIIRRFIATGTLDNPNLSGNGVFYNPALTPDVGRTQVWYGIVFNRRINVTSGSVTPIAPNEKIVMSSTTALGSILPDVATLNSTDFVGLDNSNTTGTPGAASSFTFDIGKTHATGIPGSAAPVWSAVNDASATNNVNAILSPVTTSGTQRGMYLVTNPAKFGGYTMLANITNIIVASYLGAPSITVGTPAPTTGAITASSDQIAFRNAIANVTHTNNNISTTFNPDIGITFTTDPCFPNSGGLNVAGPVSGFAIPSPNGQPVLELLA